VALDFIMHLPEFRDRVSHFLEAEHMRGVSIVEVRRVVRNFVRRIDQLRLQRRFQFGQIFVWNT